LHFQEFPLPLALIELFPKKFSEIGERFASPIWSISLIGTVGLIGVFLTYMNITAVLGITTTAEYAIIFFLGSATMLFPYIRSDLYELSPIKKEVAGIPLVTILGAYTVLGGSWLMFFL
jgi:amino acid transporter